MSDSYFNSHFEVEHLNKPWLAQMKRVWRMVKKIPNKEKPKKLGFYLQTARKLAGSAIANEKIIKELFGKSQEMSPTKFIKKIFEYEAPTGKKSFIKPETGYQTTQRLMPDEKLNKTISVSIFGDIYDKILDKYKKKPEGDDIIRSVNKHLSSHFSNAAGFVRWTNVSPQWIHIDAFQTDFFNELKRMKFEREKSKEIVDDLRKHEDEFFKTAMSYIVRTNPGVKMFTANTSEIVKAVENIRGDVKLKKYYHKIPKTLGFQLISMDRLRKILRTRPGKKAEALIGKFGGAISSKTGGKKDKVELAHIKVLNGELASSIMQNILGKIPIYFTQKKALSNEQIDLIIRKRIVNDQIAGAYHQYLNEIAKIINDGLQKKEGTRLHDKLRDFFDSKTQKTLAVANKEATDSNKIWWSDRTMIFESTKFENRTMILEQIKQLVEY